MKLWIGFLLAWSSMAALADGRGQLDAFVNELSSLSGEFEQLTQDSDGFLLERSTGQFAVQAPAQFRWDYQNPFPQLIMADGTSVWVHDIELEQVSVREQAADGTDSPLALLADPSLLDRQYQVSQRVDPEGMDWLTLIPNKPDSQFQKIELGLRDDRLQKMIMIDSFAQVTEIRFLVVTRNPVLGLDTFRFSPPEGVDIMGELPPGYANDSPLITPYESDGR